MSVPNVFSDGLCFLQALGTYLQVIMHGLNNFNFKGFRLFRCGCLHGGWFFLGWGLAVEFNARPASNFLNTKYFKAQKKKIQRTPSRWENVGAKVSMHSWKPEVYIDFPSPDATPVFNVDGKEYYTTGYKYRVILSKDIGI